MLLFGLTAPAAADCTSAENERLQVVTLNTWGLPPPLAPDRSGRLPLIEQRLREAAHDLVALQEVWSGARRFFEHPLHLPEAEGDSGLALMSRQEPSHVEFHRFRSQTGIDALKNKGFLAVHLDMPDTGRVHVVITHLQSGRGQGAARVRADQVQQILEHLESVREPVVLLGDLNLHDEHPIDTRTEALLGRAGLIDAAVAMETPETTYQATRERLDRVYVRCGDRTCVHPEGAMVLAGYESLSDHLPLQVDLHLHPRSAEHPF